MGRAESPPHTEPSQPWAGSGDTTDRGQRGPLPPASPVLLIMEREEERKGKKRDCTGAGPLSSSPSDGPGSATFPVLIGEEDPC